MIVPRRIASLRRNLGLISLFFFLTITFMLLAISKSHFTPIPHTPHHTNANHTHPSHPGKFTNNLTINKAGGGFGILTALIAYYVGLAELLIRDESWFTLPLGVVPRRMD